MDLTVRTDVHQHLWPETLLGALAQRTAAPRLRRDGTRWLVEAPGEPPTVLADHDPARRAAQSARDEVGRVLVAPSSPLGIEALPAREAEPLLDALHEGVLALGNPFALWAGLVLADPHPDRVAAALDAGAVGVALPAAAVQGPAGLARVAAALDCLEARDAPLFLHPGPAPWQRPEPAPAAAPEWWPAMTGYVAEMAQAWHAWAAWGRPAHPRLRVVFALLAGLAPVHGERLAARGGPLPAVNDRLTFFDTSSYGVRALDAMVRVVGIDRIVHGTDRPVIADGPSPSLGPAADHAFSAVNPQRLLGARTR